jgi:hypothetical protein
MQQKEPGKAGGVLSMNTIVYGEYVSAGQRASVRISSLAGLGCDLETDIAAQLFDGDCALWIGAIGPVEATATHKAARHLMVRFKEPLDGKIVAHFNCG